MKVLSVLILAGSAALAGCGTEANNANTSRTANAANMRGANTNTGYLTNSDTNARPAMPVNAVNISPPSMSSGSGNSGGNRNGTAANSRVSPAATKKP